MRPYNRFNVVSQKIITGFLIFILSISYASPASAGTLQPSQVSAPLAQTFDCGAVSEIQQAECEALVALYNSTGGANWSDNTGWLQTDTPCSWYGVGCGMGNVTGLNLAGNSLIGSIPPELGSLSNLDNLDLSYNQLSGSIPSELGNLTNLYYLVLSKNQFDGSIPPQLGSLSNLWDLDLGYNQLDGSIPPELGNLVNLNGLFLVDNLITGEFPLSITNLVNLQTITFDCGLTSPNATVTDFLNQLVPNWEQCQPNMEVRLAGMGGPPVIVNGDMTPSLGDGTVFFSVTPGETSIRTFTVGNAGMSALALIDDPMVSITGDLAFTVAVQPGGVPSSLVPPLSSGEYSWFVIEFAPTSPGFYSATVSIASNDPDDNPYIFAIQGVTSTNCATQTDIPETECDALLALYNSTDGTNWSDNTDWLQTDTPCSWSGITCAGGHVTRLQLDGRQLTGSIPAEIGNLTQLTFLRLSWNQLNGGIPTELGGLTQLTELYLDNNSLTGAIPFELGNLTQLTTLILQDNQLSGGIPTELGNLSNLQMLYLGGNQLTGSIPLELGNLTALQHLGMEGNSLTGTIPQELGNITALQDLYLGGNQLTGNILPELGNLTALQYLGLDWNSLSGSIPPELGNLTSLQSLYLRGNQLTGSIPPEMGNLTALQVLDLGENQLTGNILPELGNLTDLQYLNLRGNQLIGNIPPELGNLTALQSLGLDWNSLSGSIPPELGNLTSLEYLNLYYNQLTGTIPPELGNLTNLQSLGLSWNLLTSSIPVELGNLSNLLYLTLNDNQLTGGIPTELGNLTMLEYLTLENTALSGEIPASITNLTNLYDLSLSCGLTSSNPTVINFVDGILGSGWDVDCMPAPEIFANAGPSPVGAMDMGFGWGRWMYVTFSEEAGGGGSLYLDPVSQFFTQYGQPLSEPASLYQNTYYTYINPLQTTSRWYWMSLPADVINQARALDQYAIVWRTTFSGNTDMYESFSVEAYALIVLQPEGFGKVSPVDGAVWQPTDVTLHWDSTVGATNYEYCIDTTENNACDSPDGWLGTYDTSATVSGLAPETTYYWQARAVNTAGATAADSPKWWSFTTQTAPPVVDSIQLADFSPSSAESVDFTLTFSDAVNGVDVNDFMIDATGTLSGYVVTSVSPDTGPAAVYTVTVDTGSGSGLLRLDVKDTGTDIQTPDGRDFKGGFSSGESYEIVPGGMISGVTFQADGVTPVANMAVSLVTTTGEERAKACSDGAGQFNFASVPYGVAWHVSAVPDWRCTGQPEGYTHEFWQNTHSRDEAVVVALSENLPSYTSVVFTLDQGKTNSGVVGAGGGSVTTENVRIDIPATSIANDTTFTITDGGAQYHITTGIGDQDVILSVTIGPGGTTFAQPATLTFQWPDIDNDGVVDGSAYLESDLYLSKDGVMIAGPCTTDVAQCDMATNRFTVQVNSLSEFVVGPISVAPSVTSVTLANSNPTSAASVGFIVKFSEAVSGVDASDFSITRTGSIAGFVVAGISPVTGPADTYTVTVTTGQNSGTLKLNVLNNGSIKDSAKNPLISEFTSGDMYSVTKIYSNTLLSQASYDGFILESSETSNKGGTKNNKDKLLYVGDDASNKQYRSILSFNTANLPANAQVTKVTLKLKRSGVVGVGNPIKTFRGFLVDINKGNFGMASLALGDFKVAASNSYGPFKPVLSGGWYSIDLTNGKDNLNRNGNTQIRLRFKLDDNNNSVANYLKLYSGNAGTALGPQLIVEYTVP